MALFDNAYNVGNYEHVIALIECKEPSREHGINQLKIYLGLEPHARLGIWTNGSEFVQVYKLPTAGSFRVQEKSSLPKPSENIILADEQRITYATPQSAPQRS